MSRTNEEEKLENGLQKIKPMKKRPMKVKELSGILKMIFYDGFVKKEATDLKIGDVLQGGNIVSQITPTPQKESINLSQEVKSALLDYIQAMLPGPIPPAAHLDPLFPSYDGDSGRKRLQRDLKSLNVELIHLRRDGLFHYFETLTDSGLTYEQAVKGTAGHFRKEERTVRMLIKGESYYKGQIYLDERLRKDPIMGPFFRIEKLGRYISNEAGIMIDGFFKAVEKISESYSGDKAELKNILLNDMIKAIFGEEIPERLKSALNLQNDQVEESIAGQDLPIAPHQDSPPKAKNWGELMREAEEPAIRRLQDAEEEQKRKEKRGKLSEIFEDPEASHTPEEKVVFKQAKLLEVIEKVQATFSEEEKAQFQTRKKEIEKSWIEAPELSKDKKQKKMLRRIFTERGQVIRIGVICPESEIERSYVLKAISLAEKQFKDSGGINGSFFRMFIRYDESSDSGALKALIYCVLKKVVALLGPTRSTQIHAISDIGKKYGIPMAIGGTNVTLTQEGNPWLFRCRPADFYVANAMVNYLKEEMKLTKVGILHDSDIFGAGGAELVEQVCNNKGLTVVKKENYTTGDRYYRTKLESLKKAEAEVMVVYGTSPQDAAEIQKQYRNLGSPYAYIGSPSSGMRACIELSKEAAEGLIAIADYVPGSAMQKYACEYKKEFNEELDPTAAWYYDALRILEMAVRRVGMNSQAIMSTILATQNYDGVIGTYSFTPNGDGLHKVSVIQIENGRHRLIK